jgi:hypothetical protein
MDCGEDLAGKTVRCPTCGVALKLEVDGAEKPTLVRGLSRRSRRTLWLALGGTAAVLAAFVAGNLFAERGTAGDGRKGGIVMKAWGLFFAHNELTVIDGKPSTPEKDGAKTKKGEGVKRNQR